MRETNVLTTQQTEQGEVFQLISLLQSDGPTPPGSALPSGGEDSTVSGTAGLFPREERKEEARDLIPSE